MRNYIEYIERGGKDMMTAKDYKDLSCFMGTKNPILKSFINQLQYGTSYDPSSTRVVGPAPFSIAPNPNKSADIEQTKNPDIMLYNYMPGATGY